MRGDIVITGAGGLVGGTLAQKLLDGRVRSLTLLSTHAEELKTSWAHEPRVTCLSLDEFADSCRKSDVPLEYDCLVHTAFCRRGEGAQILASLDYTRQVLDVARGLKLGSFVNISSQGVYGQAPEPPWKENTSPAPKALYSLGKAAAEILVDSMLDGLDVRHTHVRLASVGQNANFLNVFVDNALSGHPIRLAGGAQICSFIDVRDAVDALLLLISSPASQPWAQCYNLGTNSYVSIEELARTVAEIARDRYGMDVPIEKAEADGAQKVGMDSSLFMRSFGWQPRYGTTDMLLSLFERKGETRQHYGTAPNGTDCER